MTTATVEFDLFDFAFRRTGGHNSDKGQAEQAGKIGLRNGGGAGRGFNDGGTFIDPAITQPVQEQRTRQSVLQAAGRVGTFVFQIELNTGKAWQGQANKVCICRALIIGINFTDGVFNPGAIHHSYPFVILCPA